MEQEKRLKNLYIRIHKGYSLTLNDLLFLADHDKECFAKTYRHIILDTPVNRTFQKNIEITPAPTAADEEYRKRIDFLIAKIRANRVCDDVIIGVKPENVFTLIEEPEEVMSLQSRQYQYYSLIEPDRLLNVQV